MSFTLESLKQGTAETLFSHMETCSANCRNLAVTTKVIHGLLHGQSHAEQRQSRLEQRQCMRAHIDNCTAALEMIAVLKTAYFQSCPQWTFKIFAHGRRLVSTLSDHEPDLNGSIYLFNDTLVEYWGVIAMR